MNVETIGKQISAMRKEKGIKQEELANYVGVSTQAVSKWENGGVPDTDLLPKIADFFSVSVDSLFGRNITNYGDLRLALCKKILDTPKEERFKLVFECCWDMERALFGKIPEDGSISAYENNLGKNEQQYSSIMTDYGFTRMGIANRLQYFLLVPEIKNTESAFFEGIDYLSFFRDFSDKAVFEACIFLNKRESYSSFTESLLVKNLKIETEKAKEVIDILQKYNIICPSQIEIDDEIKTVYKYYSSPSFVAFLVFAREIINAPHSFSYYNAERNKPYLK